MLLDTHVKDKVIMLLEKKNRKIFMQDKDLLDTEIHIKDTLITPLHLN